MATLNIKNFPDDLHAGLKEQAKRNGRSVSAEVERIVSEALIRKPRRSLLELQGLGKGLWKGIDVEAFIRKERKSWGR